jgi:uncharacterized protein (DUF433 family)
MEKRAATRTIEAFHHPGGGSTMTIYAGRDPRGIAAYGIIEVARYLDLAPATLRSWVVGREYPKGGKTAFFKPIIEIADPKNRRMSFNDLAQAHVLRALRTEHAVAMHDVRNAIKTAEKTLGIKPLLLSKELCTYAGEMLVDRFGQLVSLNKAGQLLMRKLLLRYLKRIEWDSVGHPNSLFPILDGFPDEPKLILINPRVGFGRPIISERGVATAAIIARINAGESEEDIIADYDLKQNEFDAALQYERHQLQAA